MIKLNKNVLKTEIYNTIRKLFYLFSLVVIIICMHVHVLIRRMYDGRKRFNAGDKGQRTQRKVLPPTHILI